MSEECAELMVEKGVVLEPTTLCIKLVRDRGRGEMHDTMVDKAAAYWELKEKEFAMILEKGVTISFSSDMGCPYLYHGENAIELASMVELGMKPMDAIVAATKTAANTIGLGDEIGTIAEGKIADIILIDGDPLSNIALLQEEANIKLVMKGGEIIVTR